jgi:diamine N-acetyltransferase
MTIRTKNNKEVLLSRLESTELDALSNYLDNLSSETRRRFGPHPFDKAALIAFYSDPLLHRAFIAIDTATNTIIAYAIIKAGYLEHDSQRLQSYGLTLSSHTDCTFAPSVADEWQGLGIGNSLLQYIILVLKPEGRKRLILWGGVQAGNAKAFSYYTKSGFTLLGQFEYNGPNYDMLLDIQ